MNSTKRVIEQRSDVLFEVSLIGGIDLGRDFQGPAARGGDGDGTIHSLFWRDSPQKRQVLPCFRMEP